MTSHCWLPTHSEIIPGECFIKVGLLTYWNLFLSTWYSYQIPEVSCLSGQLKGCTEEFSRYQFPFRPSENWKEMETSELRAHHVHMFQVSDRVEFGVNRHLFESLIRPVDPGVVDSRRPRNHLPRLCLLLELDIPEHVLNREHVGPFIWNAPLPNRSLLFPYFHSHAFVLVFSFVYVK